MIRLQTDTVTLYQGHAIAMLRQLADNSVNCIVTSPPYWGLRSYKTLHQIWGGSPDCDHDWEETQKYLPGGSGQGSHKSHRSGEGNIHRVRSTRWKISSTCLSCGAWQGELGQEATPKLFIDHLMMVFAEAHRVLRKDGVMWLNMGDCYDKSVKTFRGKGLSLIPSRLAIALSESGWCVRSQIPWVKTNACPEGDVKDRPFSSWEPVYLITKTDKYWFDVTVLEEPVIQASRDGWGSDKSEPTEKRHGRDVWNIPASSTKGHIAPFPKELAYRCILSGCPPGGVVLDPFAGSGTVLCVAQEYGRRAIGIELNPKFADLAASRAGQLILVPAV